MSGVWLTRLPGLTGRSLYHGFIGFYNSDDLTYASSIAYYSLLSLFPLLLLMLSLLGNLTASEQDRVAIVGFLFRYFPRQLDFITGQLDALSRNRHLGIGSALVLVWASLGFFGALTSAVNHAWGVEKQFSYWKHKLVSFLMLVAAGLLTFLAVLLISLRGIVSRVVVRARAREGDLAAVDERRRDGVGDDADADCGGGAVVLLRAEREGAVQGRVARRDRDGRALASRVPRLLVVRPRPVALQHPRIDRRGDRLPRLDLRLLGDSALRRRVHRLLRAAAASHPRRCDAARRTRERAERHRFVITRTRPTGR